MFGMYGLAEAVNLLCEKEGIAARYGKEAAANEVGYRISAQLAEFVANTPVKYGWQKRAMLHAQSGISSDIGTTRARVCRMAMSQIRSPICKLSPRIMLIIIPASATF